MEDMGSPPSAKTNTHFTRLINCIIQFCDIRRANELRRSFAAAQASPTFEMLYSRHQFAAASPDVFIFRAR
jgi:hypothetical protein